MSLNTTDQYTAEEYGANLLVTVILSVLLFGITYGIMYGYYQEDLNYFFDNSQEGIDNLLDLDLPADEFMRRLKNTDNIRPELRESNLANYKALSNFIVLVSITLNIMLFIILTTLNTVVRLKQLNENPYFALLLYVPFGYLPVMYKCLSKESN